MRWLLLFLPLTAFGQTQVPTFRFAEGVYWSHDALLANQPDVRWERVEGEMVQLTADFRLLIEDFGYKEGGDRITPYAVSLEGRPYFFVRADERRNYHEFAAPRIWGRWVTIQYDTLQQNRYLMRAYNPANGLPFREGYVDRQNWDRVEVMVNMLTGEREDLSYAAVLRVVATERDVVQALRRDPAAGRDKLVRALSVFNDRFPLRLPYQSPLD
jgi:hypothetical protein